MSSEFAYGFVLACPVCRAPLLSNANDARCPDCGCVYHCVEGVWRLLPADRLSRYAPFLAQYGRVRAAEGWGSPSSDYYRRLPWVDAADPQHGIWSQRQRHYLSFLRRILVPLEQLRGAPLAVLDLGAGNGWLSNRLSARGHHVAAVDINTDPLDGLAARANYENRFLSVQAEFDRLPFAPGQFDLAIFNASLHYAGDDEACLREGLRTLKPEGLLIIMDSPVYADESSGAAMVRERQEAYARRYDCRMDASTGAGFLTWARLDQLAGGLGCARRAIWPVPEWRRAARRLRARLRPHGLSREAAQFPLIQVLPHPAWQPSLSRRLLRRFWEPWLRWSYRLIHRPRAAKPRRVSAAGLTLLVAPEVFDPVVFRSGAVFARQLNAALIPPGSAVLDMGTGSGIGALRAAQWARQVVAVDISEAAVRCARDNVRRHRLEERVEVRHGDLFSPLGDERFDVVLFNPPYFRGEPGDAFERAFFASGIAECFACGLADHLTCDGYALLLLSSRGETAEFLQHLRWRGFDVRVVATRDWVAEQFALYQVTCAQQSERFKRNEVPPRSDRYDRYTEGFV
jgi:methylase of polypeptide subunit release factors